MKVCGGCEHEFAEEFQFCPMCGKKFGAVQEDKAAKLNAHLMQMAGSAQREAALGRRMGQSRSDPWGNRDLVRELHGDTNL